MRPIHINSAQELIGNLQEIDISVPLRAKGRATEQCERWSICRFLVAFADSNLLSFPIRLVHRDKPDFLLELAQGKVGIEVTEVVPKNYAAINAYRDHKEIEGPFFPKRHVPGEAKLPKANLRQEANSGDLGDKWEGDSAELEWANAMKIFVLRKIAKSEESGFELFERNWLLMYDNWPLPDPSLAAAAEKLFESLSADDCYPFEYIFIDCSSDFWIFTRNGYYSQPINNVWDGSKQQ